MQAPSSYAPQYGQVLATCNGVFVQVRLATVLDHVLDTVQHLLKKKVALERAIDPDTPDIIADGSRIVQVCAAVITRSSCC